MTTPNDPSGRPGCPTPAKVGHPNYDAAVRHMAFIRRAHRARDLNVYPCSCGAWHVGHSRVLLTKRIRRTLRRPA